MYLSISYYGPESKCGICRYAGMMLAAGGHHSDSATIYSIEKPLRDFKKVRKFETAKSNHFILDNWSWASVFKTIRMLNPKKTTAHFHYPSTQPSLVYLFAPLVFRLMGFRIYHTLHEELSRVGWIKALILRMATTDIFVVKEDFKERTAISSRWVLKFFNIKFVGSAPLQILTANKSNKENELLRSLKLEAYSGVFLAFGFVFPKRNIELILENIDPNSEVLIIAGDYNVDLNYYNSLQKLVELLNLQHCVKFLGFVDNNTLSSLIEAATGIIFTNHGGVHNWNTSFLLSCYSSRPVIYLYDILKGKPKLPSFTGKELDFGLPECCSGELRAIMDDVKEKSPQKFKQFYLNDIWAQLYSNHNFHFDRSK